MVRIQLKGLILFIYSGTVTMSKKLWKDFIYIYVYIYTRTISIKEIVQSKDVLFIMSNYSLSKMSYSQIQM